MNTNIHTRRRRWDADAKIIQAVLRRAARDALRMEGMGAWKGDADLRSLRALRF